MELITQLDN